MWKSADQISTAKSTTFSKRFLPDIESYSERLNRLDLPIHILCCTYFRKIPNHNCLTILKDIVPMYHLIQILGIVMD